MKPLLGHLKCLLYTWEWDLNLLEFSTFEFLQKIEMTFQPVGQMRQFCCPDEFYFNQNGGVVRIL
jgi:hypothetical protein